MINRGYAAVALHKPRKTSNIGGVLRACGIYDVKLVVVDSKKEGARIDNEADTVKLWKHIPVVETDDCLKLIPYNAVPIAVDLLDDAVPMDENFVHPERGYYIFGPENGTLRETIVDRCEIKMYVPSPNDICMNLAAAVNVVLFDRYMKNRR